MGYKTLEITIISATDLKSVNLIGKMDVYVVVWLSGDPRTKQKTPVHKDGGTCPYWNHTVRFIVDEAAAARSGESVVFQLKHEHTFGRDKDVGEVRVPLKDLIRDNREARVGTYQVRRPSGNPKGDLKFSYRVEDAVFHQPKAAPPPPPVMAYPVPQASSSSAAYPYLPPQTAYPPMAYPPPPQTGYPYPPQQPTGYGYPQQQLPQRPRRNGGLGMGLGAGLIGGALGGLLIGDMVSDSYQDGYYDGGAGDFDMDGGAGDFDMDF